MDKSAEKKKILLIDDTPAVLQILIGILRDDYDVVVAINGEQGLELTKKIMPDLIVLDVVMPGISGYDVLKTLKADEVTKAIPVVLISGRDSDEDEEAGYNLGASAYVKKPFDASVVKQKINDSLEKISDHF